eukprot:7804266-Alexandrium_andersonii.AAC.1
MPLPGPGRPLSSRCTGPWRAMVSTIAGGGALCALAAAVLAARLLCSAPPSSGQLQLCPGWRA